MRTLTITFCALIAATLIAPVTAQILRRNRAFQDTGACANGACEAQQTVQTSFTYQQPALSAPIQAGGCAGGQAFAASAGCVGSSATFGRRQTIVYVTPPQAAILAMKAPQAVAEPSKAAAPTPAPIPALAAPLPAAGGPVYYYVQQIDTGACAAIDFGAPAAAAPARRTPIRTILRAVFGGRRGAGCQ